MRYQELIYIQNENSGVRNKDILNVNMSSDLCIFEAPVFSVSGASKLDCNCGCPDGYTLLEDNTCQLINSVAATLNGSLLTGTTGSNAGVYGINGTNFYKTNLSGNLPYTLYTSGLSDSLNIAITSDINVSTGTLWFSNNFPAYGRLNNTGVWSTPGVNNEWIGFSKCIEIPSTGIYTIGIAGDNQVRIKINSELFYNDELTTSFSFNYWRVFEITLSAGTNIIELEGYNNAGSAAFGAEIYATDIATLSSMTTTTQLDNITIFSTKEYRNTTPGSELTFDLGETFGYSCPSGYFLNTCQTPYSCSTLVMTSCTITSGEYYIIDSATTIPLTFDFISNLDTFTANSTTFKFEIYKYNGKSNIFVTPPVYKSDIIEYSAISGTSAVTVSINVDDLLLDGQYLVKGYYNFNVCTEYLNKLGKNQPH